MSATVEVAPSSPIYVTASDPTSQAHKLIELGCPVFVAKRNPNYRPNDPTSSEFHHPARWQDTEPDHALIDAWTLGDALCLVAGHGIDVVDVDTKNGADIADVRQRLEALDIEVLADVRTPSGGAHFYIRSSGICKAANTQKGIDYQGRGIDGSGTGFVYLPGTLRPKYPQRGYTWASPLSADDLSDVRASHENDQADAVATFLVGLGTKVRASAQESSIITGAEPVGELPQKLIDLVSDLGPTWTLASGEESKDRSDRFHHLVAECRRSELTQGQAITVLEPWCNGVGKFVGRVDVEVARDWPKVDPSNDSPKAIDLPDFVPRGESAEPNSWQPIDLRPILTGDYVPEVPTLLVREDGQGLLYAGRLHSFHGESESGKSLIMQYESSCRLMAGEKVLYLDFESDPAKVVGMLRIFGTSVEAITEGFTYVRPDDGLASAESRAAFNALLAQKFSLAVIDGVTDALSLLATTTGTEPEQKVANYVRLLPRRVARHTGAAVVQIDHVTKSKDGRGRYALGSQHKMNSLDGAAYLVEIAQPIAPGLCGELELRIGKDRPGQVRPNSGPYRASDRSQEAARITVDSTDPSRTIVKVRAPRSRVNESGPSTPFRPTVLMERVSMHLETVDEPVSLRQVREHVRGNAEHIGTALDRLVMEQHVMRTQGRGTTLLHKLINPYRIESDSFSQPQGSAVPMVPLQGGGNHRTTPDGLPVVPRNQSGTAQEPEPLESILCEEATLGDATW